MLTARRRVPPGERPAGSILQIQSAHGKTPHHIRNEGPARTILDLNGPAFRLSLPRFWLTPGYDNPGARMPKRFSPAFRAEAVRLVLDEGRSQTAGKSNKQGFCQGRSQASAPRLTSWLWAVSGSKMSPRSTRSSSPRALLAVFTWSNIVRIMASKHSYRCHQLRLIDAQCQVLTPPTPLWRNSSPMDSRGEEVRW